MTAQIRLRGIAVSAGQVRLRGIAASARQVRALTLLVAWAFLLSPASLAGQARTESFDSNGVPIHYVDKGRGAPVVLIHGFTGSYTRHWEAPGVMQALETAGYRVIAMDCRGHGESGKPRDPSQYGLEMVRDVVRLLDHLRIDRAHVVGYSMGGAIASQLLVKYPRRLITVTLLGAGWEGEDLTTLTEQFSMLADGFEKGDASALIRGVSSSGRSGPTPEEVAAANAALFARNDPQALAAVARGLVPLYEISASSLRGVSLPVLAIVGEQDTFNLGSVKRLAGVVRGLDVVQLPATTHASSVRPSAAPLVAFLDKHRNN
jgi:pimeloyl-ACP methyl ester carboxylesterase